MGDPNLTKFPPLSPGASALTRELNNAIEPGLKTIQGFFKVSPNYDSKTGTHKLILKNPKPLAQSTAEEILGLQNSLRGFNDVDLKAAVVIAHALKDKGMWTQPFVGVFCKLLEMAQDGPVKTVAKNLLPPLSAGVAWKPNNKTVWTPCPGLHINFETIHEAEEYFNNLDSDTLEKWRFCLNHVESKRKSFKKVRNHKTRDAKRRAASTTTPAAASLNPVTPQGNPKSPPSVSNVAKKPAGSAVDKAAQGSPPAKKSRTYSLSSDDDSSVEAQDFYFEEVVDTSGLTATQCYSATLGFQFGSKYDLSLPPPDCDAFAEFFKSAHSKDKFTVTQISAAYHGFMSYYYAATE